MAERNEETSQHPGSYNTRSNEFYNMNHKYRGKALIFNHLHYAPSLELRPRFGTSNDCKCLVESLKKLAFSIDVFCDLKCDQIMKHIEKTAKMNHSDNDCLLIVVLTHGKLGKLYAYDRSYKYKTLWLPFTKENCPTLADKPKLFVFQACQGENYDDGVTLEIREDMNHIETDQIPIPPHFQPARSTVPGHFYNADDTDVSLTSSSYMNHIETDNWFESGQIPVYPDFLLARSTVPGYFSWRKTDCGSWFIQDLCEELNCSATEMDILTLLTFVNQKVALNHESSKTLYAISDHKKQVPCFSSMLTRRLVFTEKPDNLDCGTAPDFQLSVLDYVSCLVNGKVFTIHSQKCSHCVNCFC